VIRDVHQALPTFSSTCGVVSRTTLATIGDLWKRFNKLDAKVKKAYGGKAPDWWRSTLSCPNCPSRSEVESSLQ